MHVLQEFRARELMRTEVAIHIDDGVQRVWLPLSQIEIADNHDGTITVTLPRWLAAQMELI